MSDTPGRSGNRVTANDIRNRTLRCELVPHATALDPARGELPTLSFFLSFAAAFSISLCVIFGRIKVGYRGALLTQATKGKFVRLSIDDQTGELTPLQRTDLHRRLRFRLSRFSRQVQSVCLRATRASSNRQEFVCRATLTMRDGRQSKAEDRDLQVMGSAKRVVDRLGRVAACLVAAELSSSQRTGP